MFKKFILFYEKTFAHLKSFDFIYPLIIRLFLAPIFWNAGFEKFMHIESTIEWFGNSEWGLGLPFPTIMAYMATLTEIIGSIFLITGFATRLISIPLIIVMVVAIITVHFEHGWLAIASQNSEAHIRLQGFLNWLQQNYPQRHDFITEFGQPVMLNNGVEFAVTYIVMLITLFFSGAGKYISIDYWLSLWAHKARK